MTSLAPDYHYGCDHINNVGTLLAQSIMIVMMPDGCPISHTVLGSDACTNQGTGGSVDSKLISVRSVRV